MGFEDLLNIFKIILIFMDSKYGKRYNIEIVLMFNKLDIL